MMALGQNGGVWLESELVAPAEHTIYFYAVNSNTNKIVDFILRSLKKLVF